MALRAAAICALLVVVSAGCGSGGGDKSSNSGDEGVCAQLGDVAAPRETKAPWSAPDNPMELTCAASFPGRQSFSITTSTRIWTFS